jgi:hypothetical protein
MQTAVMVLSLVAVVRTVSGYSSASSALFEFQNIPAATMTRMTRNPWIVDGVAGFSIAKAHPVQPAGNGVSIQAFDTHVHGKPHQLRMFHADATTSYVCMKNDGTPLILLNLTALPTPQNGCTLRIETRFTRSPQWLALTLRPMFKFIGTAASKVII